MRHSGGAPQRARRRRPPWNKSQAASIALFTPRPSSGLPLGASQRAQPPCKRRRAARARDSALSWHSQAAPDPAMLGSRALLCALALLVAGRWRAASKRILPVLANPTNAPACLQPLPWCPTALLTGRRCCAGAATPAAAAAVAAANGTSPDGSTNSTAPVAPPPGTNGTTNGTASNSTALPVTPPPYAVVGMPWWRGYDWRWSGYRDGAAIPEARGQVFNVLDFNATGDGEADDSAALEVRAGSGRPARWAAPVGCCAAASLARAGEAVPQQHNWPMCLPHAHLHAGRDCGSQ